jgi:hypothetical protein
MVCRPFRAAHIPHALLRWVAPIAIHITPFQGYVCLLNKEQKVKVSDTTMMPNEQMFVTKKTSQTNAGSPEVSGAPALLRFY